MVITNSEHNNPPITSNNNPYNFRLSRPIRQLVPSYYEYQTFFLVKNGIAYLNMEKYNYHEETKIVFDILEFAKL